MKASEMTECFNVAVRALSRVAHSAEPLVQIAAGRVLRRIDWPGEAAFDAHQTLEALRPRWEREILQTDFLPQPELLDRLQTLLASSYCLNERCSQAIVRRAVRRLRKATNHDSALATGQIEAIQNMLALLETPAHRDGTAVPRDFGTLPQNYLGDVVPALFARMAVDQLIHHNDDTINSNELAILNNIRGSFTPQLDQLFIVYCTLAEIALPDWFGWLAEHHGHSPNWVPMSFWQLMVSWQVSAVASWASMASLLNMLCNILQGRESSEHFLVLTFVELVIRCARAGGTVEQYGGGSIAPDVAASEPEWSDIFYHDLSALAQSNGKDGQEGMDALGSGDGDGTLLTMPAAVHASPRTITDTAAPDAQQVDAAVFCPPQVAKGSIFLVQVFLYPPGAEHEATAQAQEADKAAKHHGAYSLPLDLPPRTRVDIRLEMPSLVVVEPDAVLIWRGRPTANRFEVTVPADVTGANTIGRVRFAVAGIPAGTLGFKLELKAAVAVTAVAALCEAEAVRYRRAFVSYSSQDRTEVLKRVQAFEIAGLSVFQDVLDLKPGELWERGLYKEIDVCDVFLLFWSRAAAASEWVAKEIAYALARKAGSDDRPPTIQPVPIEGPPQPPPPKALRHLHFNDALLAHIQAASARYALRD